MSLIVEFVSMYQTKQEALNDLNDILGTKIKINRLYEWCDPDNARELTAKVANPLRGYMLDYLLRKENIRVGKEKLERLINSLS